MSNIDNYDSLDYRQYTGHQEVIKAFNQLFGILQGINMDSQITQAELKELKYWCDCQKHLAGRVPFKEILPVIDGYLSDGALSIEEYMDLYWLCTQYQNKTEYEEITKVAAQELHGLLHGILADNIVTEKEASELAEWLELNDFLKGVFPYDEINALLTSALSDGKLDRSEADLLKAFFSDFIDINESVNLSASELGQLRNAFSISGICSVCPEVIIENNVFCFTGVSSRTNRAEIADIIVRSGGLYSDTVTKKTNYLLVGNNGNPCWAYSCYGRKVEKAAAMRKSGHPIQIVHENDFWDVVI